MKILNFLKKNSLWGILFLFLACDFTSRINKDILEVQENIKNQDYILAINKYQEILNRSPSQEIKLKVLFQIGEIYSLYLNDNKSAVGYFEKIIKETDKILWKVKSEEKLADIYLNFLNQYDLAIDKYLSLLSFEPRLELYDLYEKNLSLCYLKSRQYDKALEIIKKINQDKRHEYYVRSFYLLGLLNFYKKDFDTSIINLSEYIDQEANTSKRIDAKLLLANAYETSEQLKKAYDIYYSLLGEFPNDEVIKQRLESVYRRRVNRKR